MDVEQKIEVLEGTTVDVLMEFLEDHEPAKPLVDRAKVAVAAFGSIQRRRSAENQRDTLAYMIQRDGLSEPRMKMRLASGRSGGETSS